MKICVEELYEFYKQYKWKKIIDVKYAILFNKI